MDGSAGDSGQGGTDAFVPPVDSGGPDTGVDAEVPDPVGTCEACDGNEDCEIGSYCATLSNGAGRACLPGCVPDLPECPRTTCPPGGTPPCSFNCIYDATGTGVDANICAPVGGVCCVDEDGDGYGVGIGCLGEDCNDADPEVHPDRTEICDGIDTNCNRTVDENPNDCDTGRCTDDGDGTYTAIAGGTCASATCGDGTITNCELYTCSEGGDEGTTCATACAPAGTNDDTFCIASAHCEDGTCAADVPDGGACNEDTDCSAGHCDNGYCCSSGTCCNGDVATCPGGGAVTRICTDTEDCQGSRGMTECNAQFQCVTVDGIADDRGCTSTTRAQDCGLYNPIYCDGTEVQTPRMCPISCTVDSECIAQAHCDVGFCVPDLPPGRNCSRNQDCQDGLTCTDGVCCNSVCNGSCEACDVPGFAGTCTAVPAGADLDGECAGFACSGYYDGFSGGDECYRRQDVSDAAAVCNGARACVSPDVMCPTQPRGPLQINCQDQCQAPTAGTCTGTIAGSCGNLDNPAIRTECGTGECRRDVQRCINGMPQTCMPGPMVLETCNGLDDDCNGTPDNGSPAALCPAAAGAESYACNSGTCSFTCAAGRVDLNGSYNDGCECIDDPSAGACAAATAVGNINAGGNTMVGGLITSTTDEDWYSVNFPLSSRGPGGGSPWIRLTGANASNFELDFYRGCSTVMVCGSGAPTGVSELRFVDDQSSGNNQYSGGHTTDWPATVVFRVRRVAATTQCSSATYSIAISR
ncbi:putative metal-binding motif-containing protein [Sandaracinus amylolyticus]|uniref:putative metal-binding motif-containing protein n=1 Tax=Sandaracinus amylolyticus TaxID=927083 RepID=UPI001F28EE7F|nr:putative metal-binding motif-containing protein [Sandaracinus amylolyticus]